MTVAGPSTDNILSPANRLSPDEDEELITQIQKLKDLNKKERVNKLKQELARLRLAQASTSPPPYIFLAFSLYISGIHFWLPHPLRETLLVMRSRTTPEGLAAGLHLIHLKEKAKERSSYTRFHRRSPPRDSVRGRPASPYRRAPVEVSQRPALPLPVHLGTYPSADVLLPPPQAIPTHQLAASGDSPTQGAPSHPLQPAVGEEAVQTTVPAQSQEEDFREIIYYLPQGAHLHPGETEGSVMVEWGERRYYGFKRVLVNPPAFSLTQKDQLLIYDSFLLECPLSPPETTDPASKALLRGSGCCSRWKQCITCACGWESNQPN